MLLTCNARARAKFLRGTLPSTKHREWPGYDHSKTISPVPGRFWPAPPKTPALPSGTTMQRNVSRIGSPYKGAEKAQAERSQFLIVDRSVMLSTCALQCRQNVDLTVTSVLCPCFLGGYTSTWGGGGQRYGGYTNRKYTTTGTAGHQRTVLYEKKKSRDPTARSSTN